MIYNVATLSGGPHASDHSGLNGGLQAQIYILYSIIIFVYIRANKSFLISVAPVPLPREGSYAD